MILSTTPDNIKLVVSNGRGPQGYKGDPGGNVMAIGTFAQGPSLSVPTGADLVQVSGTSTVGDDGAGRIFVYDSTVNSAYVTAHPGTSFISANGRGFKEAGYAITSAEVAASAIVTDVRFPSGDVRRYGATVGGAVDCTTAFAQAAKVGYIYIPEGDWRCTGSIDPTVDLTVRGRGMNKSRVVLDKLTGNGLFRTSASRSFNVEMADFSLAGTWGVGGNYANGGHLIEIVTTGIVRLNRCRFTDSRQFGVTLSSCEAVFVTDCEVKRTRGDGLHFSACKHTTVANSYFKDTQDDAIGTHTHDSEAWPVQHSVTIVGNRFVDCQGVAALGAKNVVIADNTFTRCVVHAISIAAGASTEGNTALLALTIVNNTIDTMFRGTTFSSEMAGDCYGISIFGRAPTSTGAGYVGQPDGSGGIVQPYPYFYTNDTDATPPVPGTWGVTIASNNIFRTLAPTANYTDYGYGQRLSRGGPVNPQVLATHLGLVNSQGQIVITGSAFDMLITGNRCEGGGRAIWFNAPIGTAYLSLRNVHVTNNKVSNWSDVGAYIGGNGVVEIYDNHFNGDPLHAHPARAANGTWTASYAQCTAIFFSGTKGVVARNTFRNVGAIYGGAAPSLNQWKDNLIFCNPTALSYNAANAGVAYLPSTPGSMYGADVVIEDSDPSSATFGQIINACPTRATAVPSSGKFIAGHFIRNEIPTATGTAGSQTAVSSWTRLTTGSSHALNTDWRAHTFATGT